MKKISLSFGGILFLFLSAVINLPVFAQTSESCFRGTVKDADGAVLPEREFY
jgi:hypothetical protein